jgi:glucose/arabinose dehydrogenase
MRRVALPAVVVGALLLSGCEPSGVPTPVPTATSTPTSTAGPAGPVTPVGTPTVVAANLTVPWSIVPLESGSTLVSERDTAIVKEITASGEVRDVGVVPGVVPGGEGGLLGLAVLSDDEADDEVWLYAYFTAASDNRIERFELLGNAGSYSLGRSEAILTGIAKAGNHNGGRIKFGPDGMLYATTGDAGNRDLAQDPGSLNGKILRMTSDGLVPGDNPFDDSYVYSLGHRNPQGIAWDRDGRLWAAEFGQNTWDELNLVEPGANYGWPVVEGVAGDVAYVNPVQQWATSEASPSGLLWTRDTLFLAALRGQRLWAIYTDGGVAESVPWFVGEFGRIRDVVAGSTDTILFITNNTDRLGAAQPDDDKLWEVRVAELQEG